MSPLGRDNAHVKWDEPFPVPPHIEKAAVTTEGGRTVQVPKLGSGGAMNESFAYTWNEVVSPIVSMGTNGFGAMNESFAYTWNEVVSA